MAKRIDLERARAAEERIATTLRAHPEVAERTARFLAGDPSVNTMETLMDEKLSIPIQIRIPEDLLGRADALQVAIAKDPALRAMGRITRTAVLRLAILHGLEVLEQQYSQTSKGRK